jgi:hypothetical protein
VQNVQNNGISDLFLNWKTRELGPRAVDHRDSGSPWTGLRRRPEELIGALPMGTLVQESSPRLLGKNEELVGVWSRASPEVEEQRGGRATAVTVLGESAAQAWREEKRSGESCGETRGWCLPFIGGRGYSGGNAGE